MSAAVLAKIKKAGGAAPSELELSIAQEMHALEVSRATTTTFLIVVCYMF